MTTLKMPKYKSTLRIPTSEPYAYIEVVIDDTPENIKEVYDYFTNLVKVNEGLPNKEWLKVVEHYLETTELSGGAETWAKLSKYQQDWVQETKRAIKRLKAKEDK